MFDETRLDMIIELSMRIEEYREKHGLLIFNDTRNLLRLLI